MKKKLLILFALCAALALLNYCRTPAPAIGPAPENQATPAIRLAHNVAVGQWSATALYDNGHTEFHILFSDSAHVGMAMYRVGGSECWEQAETCAWGREWTACWGANFIRINADGTTEAEIDGAKICHEAQ